MQDLLGLDRNDQLEYFFEISVDLMAIIGTDKKVKKVSKCCKELLGWSEEELTLSEWSNFVHEDDVFKVLSYIRNSNIKNGIKGLELRFKCKDESYRWIESNCRYVEESEVYILTARDITEKKQIMEEKIAYEKAIELESIKSQFFSNISHEFKTPLNIILATMQVINKNIENKSIISIEGANLDWSYVNILDTKSQTFLCCTSS